MKVFLFLAWWNTRWASSIKPSNVPNWSILRKSYLYWSMHVPKALILVCLCNWHPSRVFEFESCGYGLFLCFWFFLSSRVMHYFDFGFYFPSLHNKTSLIPDHYGFYSPFPTTPKFPITLDGRKRLPIHGQWLFVFYKYHLRRVTCYDTTCMSHLSVGSSIQASFCSMHTRSIAHGSTCARPTQKSSIYDRRYLSSRSRQVRKCLAIYAVGN